MRQKTPRAGEPSASERANVKKKTRDLKEECIREGLKIIAKDGIGKLSLREVARRLGVSHQAPYKHFPSRDHILAAIVARSFDAFARHLDRHPKTDDPDADMGKMGQAYLEYAHRHALEYGLMFNTPLPDGKKHPEMMANAKHAFALLCDALRRKARLRGGIPADEAVMLDALFIWSGLHGLASIAASSTVATLEITPPVLARSGMHLLQRLSQAMDTPK